MAQRAFADGGFEATSLREVTDRAGLAHGMVRHHFGTKLGLWQAVVDRAADRYRTAVAPFAGEDAGERAGVLAVTRAGVRSFLEVSARHPDLVRLLLHESVGGGDRLAYVLDRFAPVAAMMAPLFRRVQDAGYLRQFDQRAFFLFLLTTGAMPFALSGLSTGILHEPLRADSEQGREHIDRILHTLYGPEPSPGPEPAAADG
ncbi:MAG: TetR/AcrR family transcriptional regulator [Dactylosporangium sp.]|nr:TetR/AcrR family transcriptional regulator [Dactylosporangium sp.]